MAEGLNVTTPGREDNMTLTVTMGSLGCVGYIYSISLIIFNLKFKNLRFVKMTSPRINLILITGAILMYTFCVLIAVDLISPTLNQIKTQVQYWVFTIGFTLMVGSMIVKGWRVYQLFNDQNSKNKSIRDSNLLVGLLVFLVFDISLMLGWQLSDPITCNAAYECTSVYQSLWILILVLYKQTYLIACCAIGWCIRHVCFPALDDGRSLVITAMISVMSCGLVMSVSALYHQQSSITLCLTALLSWVSVTASLTATFLHKILVIQKTGGKEPYLSSTSKYSIQQPMSGDVGEEMVKILGENHSLKHQIEERDTMINHLRHALPIPIQTDMEINSAKRPNKHQQNSKLMDKLCLWVGKTDNKESLPSSHSTRSVKHTTTVPDGASTLQPPAAEGIPSSPMHTRAVIPTLSSNTNTIPNMDLICSIADTYDLPSDSDTYSYISNCLLNQVSFDSSADRRLRRSHASLSSTIGNDQIYPDHPTSTFRQHSTESHRKGKRHHKYHGSRPASRQSGRHHHSVSVIMTESNGSTVML